MSTNRYRVCGLTLESQVDLPELPPGAGEPDVHIRIQAAPEPQDLPPIGPLTRADRDHLWLHVPGVARFWAREGREILVDPEPGCDEGGLNSLLLASPLAALLFQRDRLVMHGTAVEIDGQALLILGSSGSGKSTLAASLMQRGHTVLADDVVALDDRQRVLPGIPRLKLWRNALKMLHIAHEELAPLHPGLERYHLPLTDAFTAQPVPVRWVVLLSISNRDELLDEALNGMQRFMPLRKNTYRISFMDHMGLKAQHMSQIAALSAQTRLQAIAYPGDGDYVGALTDRLLEIVHAGET